MPNQNLSRFVFRHYLRSALVPVLTVELLIILIYFGVNSWVTRQTERSMMMQARANTAMSVIGHSAKVVKKRGAPRLTNRPPSAPPADMSR